MPQTLKEYNAPIIKRIRELLLDIEEDQLFTDFVVTLEDTHIEQYNRVVEDYKVIRPRGVLFTFKIRVEEK